MICRDGVIDAVGPYAAMKAALPPDATLADHSGCLIAPGFIDTHIHYVQTGIIGAQGRKLLEWLEHLYLRRRAGLRRRGGRARRPRASSATSCLRNGTTTALVFCSVHAGSVDALFEEAQTRNLRLIAGKVLMDRNAPAALLDTAQSGYDQSKALIAQVARPRPRALRDHAALRRRRARRSSSRWRARSGASIPRCSCRPTSRRTATRSPG